MKKLILIILILGLTGYGLAEISHSLDVNESAVKANTTIQLTSEQPVNSWNMNYELPQGGEIQYIEDSIGSIDSYSAQGGSINFETNTGNAREEEYVRINYIIDDDAEEHSSGLYSRTFSFSGFDNENSSGTVRSENLISGRVSDGFETGYTQNELSFEGEGPVQITVNFGEGEETEYFTYFGEDHHGLDKDSLDEAYELALGAVGHQQRFERFPVGVDEDFEGNEWAAGEYFQGRIMLRPQDEIKPVLTHEAVHGLNDRLLSWDQTDSAWFDEGVAKHAEDLARVKENGRERTSELFGEEVQYREDGYIYTLPSRGDREELWNYYQEDQDFMKEWSPRAGNRDFGYYYSELIIKYHLKNNGTVSEIYSDVRPEEPVNSNEEKWGIYNEHLELRPCDYEGRESFDQCLDDVNQYEFEVRMAEPVYEDEEINVREVHIPERSHLNQSITSHERVASEIDRLIIWLMEVLGL